MPLTSQVDGLVGSASSRGGRFRKSSRRATRSRVRRSRRSGTPGDGQAGEGIEPTGETGGRGGLCGNGQMSPFPSEGGADKRRENRARPDLDEHACAGLVHCLNHFAESDGAGEMVGQARGDLCGMSTGGARHRD